MSCFMLHCLSYNNKILLRFQGYGLVAALWGSVVFKEVKVGNGNYAVFLLIKYMNTLNAL